MTDDRCVPLLAQYRFQYSSSSSMVFRHPRRSKLATCARRRQRTGAGRGQVRAGMPRRPPCGPCPVRQPCATPRRRRERQSTRRRGKRARRAAATHQTLLLKVALPSQAPYRRLRARPDAHPRLTTPPLPGPTGLFESRTRTRTTNVTFESHTRTRTTNKPL